MNHREILRAMRNQFPDLAFKEEHSPHQSGWCATNPADSCRYMLGRTWPTELDLGLGVLAVCMLNPSRARLRDDPTIRNLRGIALANGYASILVVNLFAFSSPRPKDLDAWLRTQPPPDRVNLDVLGRVALYLPNRLAAWGKLTPMRRRESVFHQAKFKHTHTLGLTKTTQDPRHPLYMPHATHVLPVREKRDHER